MAPQSHEPSFYLLKRRLPASESLHTLGRVVKLYQDPTFNYTPNAPSESLTSEVFNQFLLGVQHDEGAHFTAQASRDDKLWAKMKGLVSMSSDSGEGGSTEVISPRITTRRLRLEGDYFKALREVPEARRKILEMCPVGGKAYLIVGTMSIQTAQFKLTGTRQNNTKVSGSLPAGAAVTAAAAAGGVPVHPKMVPNPQVGVQRTDSSDWSMEFKATATGDGDETAEEIFAIACKEITRNWVGLGNDVQLKAKRPEYRGGQNFGDDNDSDSDEESEDDNDEEGEMQAAEGLSLKDTALIPGDGAVFFRPSQE